jgi:hypothetical protein
MVSSMTSEPTTLTFTIQAQGQDISFVSAFASLDTAYTALALAPHRSSFANDLLKAARERRLSRKQVAWLHKLATDAVLPADLPDPDLDLSPIVAMMDRAHSAGKRRPQVVLLTDAGHKVRLVYSGSGSRYQGTVAVTDSQPYPQRRVFGRVNRDGTVTRYPAWRPAVEDLLRRLAQNPTAVAKQHGVATGECCFCAKALATRESRSVGYGPICAAKFGLPWGDTTVADAEDAAARAVGLNSLPQP